MYDVLVCWKLWFWRDPNQTTPQDKPLQPSLYPHRNSCFKGTLLGCFPQADYLAGLPLSPYLHPSTSRRLCMGVRPSDLLSGLTPTVRKPVSISRLGCSHDSPVWRKLWFRRDPNQTSSQPGPTLPSLYPQPNSCFEETLLGCFAQSDFLAGLPPSPYLHPSTSKRLGMMGFAHPTSYQD